MYRKQERREQGHSLCLISILLCQCRQTQRPTDKQIDKEAVGNMKCDVEDMPSHYIQAAQLVIEHDTQVDHGPDAFKYVDEVIHGHAFDQMIFFDRCGIVKMKACRKGIGIRYQYDYRNDAERNGIEPIAMIKSF
jgi:hypothetical protein